MRLLHQKMLAACVLLVTCLTLQARDKVNINLGWKFIRTDVPGAEAPTFDDSAWQSVDLPHDAAVHHAFQKKGNGASPRVGFLPLGQGWYRRHVTFRPEWRGQRVVIEFEGVYRKAEVYINGQRCEGENPNGYMDFEFDITDKLHEGDNVIAVSYDNRYEKSSRWYNGEGIHRDVWLHVLDPVHVARYGTYVTTPKITAERARVSIETAVLNQRADSVLCRLVTDIRDPQGKVVASRTAVAPFAPGETFTFRQEIDVPDPELWNVGDGRLYTAVSNVYVDGTRYNGVSSQYARQAQAVTPADVYVTAFGIRDIEFTPERGLFVNGRRVYVNGVCLHTDLGPLGTASLNAAWDRRLSALTRELGCNGLRLSHNAYPKYVLDWADRHGVLIVDEFFDKWEDSYYGRGAKMGALQLRDVRTQIARDRNHPSVFLWSVGNETYQQIRKDFTHKGGVEMLKMLVDEVRRSDPSRKVTYSQYPNRYGSATKKRDARRFEAAEPHQFEFYTDIVSTNYLEQFWDRDHKKFPQLIFMEGEMAVNRLGYDFFNFDHSYPVGQFYWGGTDYIGESTGWPAKGWTRGLLDFTNRLKPAGWSVRSFYTDNPMVKVVVIPDDEETSLVWNDLKMSWSVMEMHWNYADNQPLKIQVMSNCDETELFVNGQSLGRKQLPPKNQAPELVWTTRYKAGEIKAVGYKNGIKVAEDHIRTAGKPASLTVECDTTHLKADGLDVAYLTYTVRDKEGNVCPDPVRIDFTVSGEGTNAGVASSDMLSDEPWQGDFRTTHNGRAQLIIRSADRRGEVRIRAKAKGMKAVTMVIPVR